MKKTQLMLGVAIGIFISSSIFFISFQVYKYSNNEITLANESLEEIDDEYIIDRATQMGMIFFDKVLFEDEEDNDIKTSSGGNITIDDDDYVYVTIPKNCTTEDVATILEREGLVDKDEFINFVVNEGKSRDLRYGYFLVPKDATYEQLVDIFTK